MCCGEAFWKRVVVFCLTFGLGVFVSTFFALREAQISHCPSKTKLVNEKQKPENGLLREARTCAPVDGNLKYERLTTEEKNIPLEEKPNLEPKKQVDKKKSLKVEKQKKSASPQPQFYNPAKDSAEYKNLLHREKCFESDGRK